ncbi:uncharacterized protein LOC9640207 [Selaginella moellendorffii]|uniref:uncharacterized protein LOC9640207 n=1 Tax=Selaginella moellendorffii TaxID=88036 RepID=UPI000D1CC6A3|nr:uncharacterized protein LOC9640207 [Selaginella moellendorffii]|eukprot:XP_024532007.1 uncharacterized protein LOC9640207 [Selaginella moellendorffii]
MATAVGLVVKSESAATAMANGARTHPPPPPPPCAAPTPGDSKHQLLHNPGLAVEWSAEEQSILDESLHTFGSEAGVWKYIKIAALLSDKSVRDVALRCRWMAKKEVGKRRKAEEQHNASKKSKDKKDKTVDVKPSTAALAKTGGNGNSNNNNTSTNTGSMPMYSTTPLPIDADDGISNEAIGGTAGELFDQNLQVVVQIRANLAAGKAQENTDLLAKFRDNLEALLDGMSNVSGIMSHMPPLQIAINRELADTILPTKSQP